VAPELVPHIPPICRKVVDFMAALTGIEPVNCGTGGYRCVLNGCVFSARPDRKYTQYQRVFLGCLHDFCTSTTISTLTASLAAV
jgi:hypothetical protein